MPELSEVESARRILHKAAVGKKILEVRCIRNWWMSAALPEIKSQKA